MKHFFEASIAECRERKKTFQADGRADEAVFEQVRCNVYEIFQTIWNMDRGVEFFLEKLTTIPLNWQASLVKARDHDDVETMTLETIKLDTVQQIGQALEERQ